MLIFLFYAFTGHIESVSTMAALGALFLGPWQLTGSVITTIKRRPFYQLRRLHLIGSGLYFLVCAIGVWQLADHDELFDTFLMTFGFALPAVLALLYYYVTFKTYQLTR
jgi:hypothetical protein